MQVRYLFAMLLAASLTACHKPAPSARQWAQLAYVGQGNVQAGKELYAEQCLKCHALRRGANNKGPQLLGVYGARAAALADYKRYSKAMRNAGMVWTPNKLDAYIAQPKQQLPGTIMHYDGLSNATARQHIIAYLATLQP